MSLKARHIVVVCVSIDFVELEIMKCIHVRKGGTKYRPLVKQLGGKTQFPFLLDEEYDTKLYESGRSVFSYLFEQYGRSGKTPKKVCTLSQNTLCCLCRDIGKWCEWGVDQQEY